DAAPRLTLSPPPPPPPPPHTEESQQMLDVAPPLLAASPPTPPPHAGAQGPGAGTRLADSPRNQALLFAWLAEVLDERLMPRSLRYELEDTTERARGCSAAEAARRHDAAWRQARASVLALMRERTLAFLDACPWWDVLVHL